jgi:hypothetical protein
MKNEKKMLICIALQLMSGCFLFRSYYLSDSAESASRRGTFVCHVDVEPKELDFHGHKIQFREAWLEETYFGDAKACCLCFTLAQGEDEFRKLTGPMFVGEGDGGHRSEA